MPRKRKTDSRKKGKLQKLKQVCPGFSPDIEVNAFVPPEASQEPGFAPVVSFGMQCLFWERARRRFGVRGDAVIKRFDFDQPPIIEFSIS